VFAVAAGGTDFAVVAFAFKQNILLVAILMVEATLWSADVVPPPVSVELESTATSGSRISGAGLSYGNVHSASFSTSLLRRWQIGDGKWFQGVGLKAESFSFTPSDGLLPSRLQDVAAQYSLERFEQGECVASLTLSPGWYFEKHMTRSAWDVPFEAVSGIPITSGINGALGLSNGRFYHHAVPIAGVIWQVTTYARIEAIYPAPALVITTSKNLSFRLGGELAGGGFRTDSARDGVVEYDSYRIGATVNYTWRHLQLTCGTGVEVENNFDFFRQGQRLHGSGAGYGKLSVEWTH
jgi:hypothetical protein